MGDKLQNFSCSYSSTEDRLLLKIGTNEETGHAVWLTRRFLRGLWDGLMKFLAEMPEVTESPSRQVKEAVLAIRHQESVTEKAQSIARTPNPKAARAGEAALATGATVKPQPGGTVQLILRTEENALTLTLDEQTLHGLCHLLINTSGEAGWDLDLKVGDGNIATAGTKLH